ncbi:RNA polymerase sigma factor [compost metagenome]
MNVTSTEDAVDQLAASQATPEESCVDKESYEELGRALSRLSERDRQLLVNKYFLGLKDREMAPLMGIPVRNIQAYLTRARRRALSILSKEREEHEGRIE